MTGTMNRPEDTASRLLLRGLEVCALSDVPEGGGSMRQLAVGPERVPLLVLRSGAQCYGYINRCPHFGMPLAVQDAHLIVQPHQWVKCNVHYARFRWQDGFCEAGDCAGESLERVDLCIVNGRVVVA
jgi:nitrite reductase/ring-hydroxylating ferredoxin subunit